VGKTTAQRGLRDREPTDGKRKIGQKEKGVLHADGGAPYLNEGPRTRGRSQLIVNRKHGRGHGTIGGKGACIARRGTFVDLSAVALEELDQREKGESFQGSAGPSLPEELVRYHVGV